jgi:hypothetical protein
MPLVDVHVAKLHVLQHGHRWQLFPGDTKRGAAGAGAGFTGTSNAANALHQPPQCRDTPL